MSAQSNMKWHGIRMGRKQVLVHLTLLFCPRVLVFTVTCRSLCSVYQQFWTDVCQIALYLSNEMRERRVLSLLELPSAKLQWPKPWSFVQSSKTHSHAATAWSSPSIFVTLIDILQVGQPPTEYFRLVECRRFLWVKNNFCTLNLPSGRICRAEKDLRKVRLPATPADLCWPLQSAACLKSEPEISFCTVSF